MLYGFFGSTLYTVLMRPDVFVAVHEQRQNKLDPPVVVGTVMSNLGLEVALRESGIDFLRAPVGD